MFTEATLFLTLYNNTLRVALTSKQNSDAIIYTCINNREDPRYGYGSFKMFPDAFTKNEYLELIKMYSEGHKQKVISIIKNKLELLRSSDNYIGPFASYTIAEFVPDEWFDGCKTILNILEIEHFKGIYYLTD